ncbi:MAG TPA: hypothetical protein VKX96_16980 [Chloroflexota bacterium]|jgi:hypothetical protein|nr:hypothetical protein [Chloroflexota bacterium]
MSQWTVAGLVSRVAERVSTAGEDLADMVSRRSLVDDLVAVERLQDLFPPVEPSPDFTESLHRQLMAAPVFVPAEYSESPSATGRRLLYGVAAVGSLASAAAVVAVIVYRSRPGCQRPAA